MQENLLSVMKLVRKGYSIQSRFLGVCLGIALGTTMVSLMISYYTELDTVRNTTKRYMTQYISYADRDFNEMLSEAKKISLSVVIDRTILYPALVGEEAEASYEGYRNRQQVRSYLSGLMTQKEYVKNVMVVSEKGEIYQANSELFMKKDLEKSIVKEALESEKMELHFDRETGEVILSRPFYYRQAQKAVCMVFLDDRELSKAYKQEPLQDVTIFIFYGESALFYTNASGMEGQNGEAQRLLNEIREQPNNTGYLTFQNQKYYSICYESGESGIVTISMVPHSNMMKDVDTLRGRFLLIGLCAAVAAGAVSIFLSGKLCMNLRRLTFNMKEVRAGDLQIRADIKSKDEIGELADNFNHMMDQIGLLMEEVKIKEKAKRDAEQSVLATQIEPHFLYNSIDSIQHVAHMRKEREIEEVAIALSELLRCVLTNCDELITLWEEKEYIENYIKIERFKYRESFLLSWDVDEELWACRIPKLLLQPIVENALIHGIATREESGMIHVKVYREAEEIVFKVMDNGKGMEQEKIDRLMKEIHREDKSGFRRVGIANVFNRIRLIYGENYGGTIYSCEEMFTCVELRIPNSKEELRGERNEEVWS